MHGCKKQEVAESTTIFRAACAGRVSAYDLQIAPHEQVVSPQLPFPGVRW
jgi:hypothetical protein